MNHSYDHSQQFAFEYIKVESSFMYHCPAVLAPHYDRGLTGSVLSTATQWGPGRTGQIEVVKKELCSHVTGSCFALRPGIPVDPLRSHMNTMTRPDLLTAISIRLTWSLKTCLTDLIQSKEMSQTHSIKVWSVHIISVPFNTLQLMLHSLPMLQSPHICKSAVSWKETSQHILWQSEHCGLLSMRNLVTMVTLEDCCVG